MKIKLKSRQSLYIVVRRWHEYPAVVDAVLDVFFSLQAAEDKAGAYMQEFIDKGVTGYFFNVVTSSYYDE